MVIDGRAQAILWAQWRSILNFYQRPQMGGFWVGSIVMVVWYLMVLAGAVGLSFLVSVARQSRISMLESIFAFGLLVCFLYWQVVPVFLASTGLSIDLRRLLVYPVRTSQLFQIEVLLRISTGLEVVLILFGVAAGAWMNPTMPKWGPLALLLYLVFNLYLSAGIRDLVGRLMERKGAREAFVLFFVVLMVMPQMIAVMGLPPALKEKLLNLDQGWLPWGATAALLLGNQVLLHWVVLGVWTVAAMLFGRWQFERSLHFDSEGERAKQAESTASSTWLDGIFRLPGLFFRDPLAALLEKDLRQLARAPRFRLVFFMGFTFGLVVWLPLAFGKNLMSGNATVTGPFSANYLTWISVYSVMMLGEVAIFNNLGFDRSAAQFYWAAPVQFRTAMLSKNLAASFFIFLELLIITIVCLLLRLPITPMKIAEAFTVTIVMALFFSGIGNIGSVYSPRAANPQNAWRQSSGGKIQLWLLVVYPCLAIPIFLAYLARYAFESEAAFFVVLGITAGIGWIFRGVATDTAIDIAMERREKILTVLSEGDGPIR